MKPVCGTIKEVAFPSGPFRLSGVLHLPGVRRPPVVIGCHGLLSTKASPKQIALAQKLTEAGIAYFRFDHRGCGRSQGGGLAAASLAGRVEDLVSAWEWLARREPIGESLGLFGSSMGGAVCIAAASRLPTAALVTYAAPLKSGQVAGALEDARALNRLPPELDPASLRFDLTAELETLARILVIHGNADRVVPVASAREIFLRAAPPKRLIIQEGGDHPMGDPGHQTRFVQEAAAWFRVHLPRPATGERPGGRPLQGG